MIVSVHAFLGLIVLRTHSGIRGPAFCFFYINTSLEMTATFPNCAVIVTMSGDRGYVYLSIKHDRRSREVSSHIHYVAIMRHIAVKERYISFINIVKKRVKLFY